MILCDIWGGGFEGLWYFTSAPREGEYVQIRFAGAEGGLFRVTRVVHHPSNLQIENCSSHEQRAAMRIYVTQDGQFGAHPPGYGTGDRAQG